MTEPREVTFPRDGILEKQSSKENQESTLALLDEHLSDGKCSLQSWKHQAECNRNLQESLRELPSKFKMNKNRYTESAKADIASALVSFQKQVLSQENTANMMDSERMLLLCPHCRCFYVFPVTLRCGHTLCKTCVLPGNGDQNTAVDCKKCGSKDYTNKLSVNVLIKHLIQKWFPRKYESEVEKLEDVQRNGLQREQSKVVETLSDVLSNSPFNFKALKWRSYALFQMGMCQQALRDANLACLLRPFLPCVFYQRGATLVAMDNHEKAAVSFARCLALDPTNAEYQLELLSCLNKLLFSGSAHLSKEELIERFKELSTTELTSSHSKVLSSEAAVAKNQEDTRKELQSGKRNSADTTSSSAAIKSVFLGMTSTLKRPHNDNSSGEDSTFTPLKCPKLCKRDEDISYHVQEPTRTEEDVACEICYSVLFQPVTTTCGHTFCRDCLQRSLDFRPVCPYCRQSLDCGASRNTEVTREVKEITEKLFPDDYAARERCFAAEKAHWKGVGIDASVDVPIFVCMVAFPSLKYPLHIFEPRYRLMIRRCVELGSRMFGMCAKDPEKGFSDYGTMLYVEKMEILPDGRYIIQTTARRRFRVVSRAINDGYNTAKVEWLEDEKPQLNAEVKELEALSVDCSKFLELWFNSLTQLQQTCITNAIGPMPCLEDNPVTSPDGPSWLWWALAAIPLKDTAKLIILSMTSLDERFQSIRRFLELLITVR